MSIQTRQNLPESLDKLAAQRLLYRCAKRVRNLGFFLLILVGGLVTWASVEKNVTYSHVATFVAVVTWFIDQIVLKNWESVLKKEAATIQEEFDCFVLDLPWPEYKGIIHPTSDRIRQLASTARNAPKADAELTNWYPPDAIPGDPTLAKVRCQRMNSWWDMNLRRQWKTVLIVVFCCFVILTTLISVITGITVAKLTALVASNLRILAWGISEINAQSTVIERSVGIHRYLSSFSGENPPPLSAVRGVQDEIFEHRRSNPPVPDWFYWWKREGQELEAAKP